MQGARGEIVQRDIVVAGDGDRRHLQAVEKGARRGRTVPAARAA
jgi:hypothetical protein